MYTRDELSSLSSVRLWRHAVVPAPLYYRFLPLHTCMDLEYEHMLKNPKGRFLLFGLMPILLSVEALMN